ncbi:hypothetical protein CEB94_40140 [Streptomyces hawaiiensis]|uniref:Uncharacterized protein n=1 Tax=Streptomyces hawaiiensis TaxID=67305 RepID=A0A6G5RQZ4_9ACTN|nr:hypothetical protein CEB94_40140 [Streptomyces hawaiiensis]
MAPRPRPRCPRRSPGAAAYDEPVLKVTGAYIPQPQPQPQPQPPPPTSDMAAGYLTVTNTGRQPDRLRSG